MCMLSRMFIASVSFIHVRCEVYMLSRMFIASVSFIHARCEVCMLSRMLIASVSFLSNQSLCLRWVTPSISWAVPYRGSLRRAHSVSASGAGSISLSNMVFSFSASCCWTVADLSFATSSFFPWFYTTSIHLASYHYVIRPADSTTPGPCLPYVIDVALSDYSVVNQMPMF